MPTSLTIYYWKGAQWNLCPKRFSTNAQVRAEVARIGLAGFRAVVSSVHLGAPKGEPEREGEPSEPGWSSDGGVAQDEQRTEYGTPSWLMPPRKPRGEEGAA